MKEFLDWVSADANFEKLVVLIAITGMAMGGIVAAFKRK